MGNTIFRARSMIHRVRDGMPSVSRVSHRTQAAFMD